ncbi:MAG: hypothetical protein ACOCYG_07735 [Spirochaetota bacterium]
MKNASRVDICLFGATGFAGRLTARHLADRCGRAGLRLALAGRSGERLEAVAAAKWWDRAVSRPRPPSPALTAALGHHSLAV